MRVDQSAFGLPASHAAPATGQVNGRSITVVGSVEPNPFPSNRTPVGAPPTKRLRSLTPERGHNDAQISEEESELKRKQPSVCQCPSLTDRQFPANNLVRKVRGVKRFVPTVPPSVVPERPKETDNSSQSASLPRSRTIRSGLCDLTELTKQMGDVTMQDAMRV